MPKSTDTTSPETGLLARLWRGLARRGRTLNEKRVQQWLAQAAETLRSELGEASGVSLARRITDRYASLPPEGRLDRKSVV